MNPFQSIDDLDAPGTHNENVSSSDNDSSSGVGESVFRRILWHHYSNSLHFFGGSLFPNTTTATTPLYNSPHYSCQKDSRESLDYEMRSAMKASYCLDSLSCPRPTDQLLKLIRRRRGASLATNTSSRTESHGLNSYQNNPTNENRDDSWNSVRYHIVSRPADCRYVCYSSNLSTPLHAACLYRAPDDVILMLLTAWPAATLQQDSEGWTPLHVHILYNHNNHDLYEATGASSIYCTSATSSLIRLGGATAASQHSKFVGSALHLACRHHVSLSILAELLQVCPSQVFTPNEAGGLPANILWKTTMKERRRSYHRHMELVGTNDERTAEANEFSRIEYESNIDLLIRLNLFLGAFLRAPILLEQARRIMPHWPLFSLHDVVRFHFECATQADYVGFFIHMYSSSVSDVQRVSRKLPIHIAASYYVDKEALVNPFHTHERTNVGGVDDNNSRTLTSYDVQRQYQFSWPPGIPTASSRTEAQQRERFTERFPPIINRVPPELPYHHFAHQIPDPLITILNAFPLGAYKEGGDAKTRRIPLHVALAEGKRTWRTGIAALVAAAPETVEWKDGRTLLYPFQLAAVSENDNNVITNSQGLAMKKNKHRDNRSYELAKLETIFCLLIDCPHLISDTSAKRSYGRKPNKISAS